MNECDYCVRFFARFSCNAPKECDCPKCQGYCECREDTERASRLRHLANLFGMTSPIERRAYLADLEHKDGKAPTDRLREIFRDEWERRNG